MKGLFVDPYFLKQEELGSKRLQETLISVVSSYGSTRYTLTTETRAHSFLELATIKEYDEKELQRLINMVLHKKKNIYLPFEQIKRELLLQWVHGSGKKKDSVRMIFYKSTPEHADKRLQTITREVILSTKILALVK